MDALPTPPRNPTSLLDIPLEIRRYIYRYCLTSCAPIKRWDRFIDPYHLGKTGSPGVLDLVKSLLLVSKQISVEALDVLYGENTFEICLDRNACYYLNQRLTEENRRKIRKLQIIIQPQGICESTNAIAELAPILSQLMRLTIIAQEPLESRSFYNAPTFEEGRDRWLSWLRSVLAFMVPHLTKHVAIEVDDGSMEASRQIFQEFLPSEYRNVLTRRGDLIFERGSFSWKSGYWEGDDYCGFF